MLATLVLVGASLGGIGSAGAHVEASRPPAPALAGASQEEAILQGRLMAPCCYVQTLDVHESELATSLRHEIRARLAGGEPAAAIEQDFVARYGERVRALPEGRDPRKGLGSFAAIAGAVAALGLGLALRKWRRAADEARPAPGAPRAGARGRDAYDERVDEELREMDA
jgi:cytochrome c-type biogenesis protein CcmH